MHINIGHRSIRIISILNLLLYINDLSDASLIVFIGIMYYAKELQLNIEMRELYRFMYPCNSKYERYTFNAYCVYYVLMVIYKNGSATNSMESFKIQGCKY